MPQTQPPAATTTDPGVMARLQEILKRAQGMFGAPRQGEPLAGPGVPSQTPARVGGAPAQLSQAPPVPLGAPPRPSMGAMIPRSAPQAQVQEQQQAPQAPMPTEFVDRKARTGAIVQSAIQGLSQFTQKLSQDRMKKQEEEAYGVANAILAAQESGNEAFMKAVTENASKGGVAKSLAKLLQAQQGGDLETVAKLSGTPVGKGLQRAITDRAAEADKQDTKQAELRESAARAASAEAEPALKAAQAEQATGAAAQARAQATIGIPAQAEVDRVTAAFTEVQAGIVGKEVQQVGDKLAVVDKATNKMTVIGDAPTPPKVDMAAYSGIFPGIEKLGKIPSEAAQITLRAKFDELSEEDKQKFTARENALDRDLQRELTRFTAKNTGTPFNQIPDELKDAQINYTVRQLLEPGGVSNFEKITAGDKTLQMAVLQRFSQYNLRFDELESGTQQMLSSSKSMVGGLNNVLQVMDKDPDEFEKLLGPISGRWSAFMVGKVGTGDPRFAWLRTNVSMISSGTMRAHVGLRGGVTLVSRFDDLMAKDKMDYDTLHESLTAMRDFLQNTYVTPYQQAVPSELQPTSSEGGGQSDLDKALDKAFGAPGKK